MLLKERGIRDRLIGAHNGGWSVKLLPALKLDCPDILPYLSI
jgi:hypothetical protein